MLFSMFQMFKRLFRQPAKIKRAAMQSATLPKRPAAPRASEQREVLPIDGRASSHTTTEFPADRLGPARGFFVSVALSAVLWAAIIGLIAALRHWFHLYLWSDARGATGAAPRRAAAGETRSPGSSAVASDRGLPRPPKH